MRKVLLTAALLAAGVTVGDAATLTLPNVIVGLPASTAIACSPVGLPPSGQYAPPLAAGTVVFACTVQPAAWNGAVALSGSQFAVTNLSGAAFNVSSIAELPSGTYAPGALTATP